MRAYRIPPTKWLPYTFQRISNAVTIVLSAARTIKRRGDSINSWDFSDIIAAGYGEENTHGQYERVDSIDGNLILLTKQYLSNSSGSASEKILQRPFDAPFI